MFTVSQERLIAGLEELRKSVCAYGPDAVRCDCKFGVTCPRLHAGSEQTGCPELRQVIEYLQGEDERIKTAFEAGCTLTEMVYEGG
jgi:hypothetical protein